MSVELLRAEKVTLRYPGLDRPALNDVSMTVQAGVPLGIVGESGSGKSSLIRCLLGLERLTTGRVLYRGQDLTAASPAERRHFRTRVQMVFQDPFNSLNPRMTIGQTLGEVLRVHGRADASTVRSRVAASLDQVGLSAGLAERFPHEVSGGQRQRVGIARAVSLQPEVLLADEPVSALDVSVQAQILELLGSLGRDLGITLVLIAHDLAVVRYACREIVVMEQGVVVEQGASARVVDAPEHAYTRALLSAVPDIDILMSSGGL